MIHNIGKGEKIYYTLIKITNLNIYIYIFTSQVEVGGPYHSGIPLCGLD